MKTQKVLTILAGALLLTSCSTYWSQVKEAFENIDDSPRTYEKDYEHVDVSGRIYDKDGNYIGRIDK